MNYENTLTRDQIQTKYIEWYIETSTLEQLKDDVRGMLSNDLDMLDNVELLREVRGYAPELIPDNITLAI
tara:strand:+ start:120 stop:329 length:210 start_codon:yes stop_codon:yes gene_type:complete